MPKVHINGKDYNVTYGPFGEYVIDGKTWDEFWASVPEDDIMFMAKKGMEVARDDPEQFADIVDRHEITEMEPFVDPKYRKGDTNA